MVRVRLVLIVPFMELKLVSTAQTSDVDKGLNRTFYGIETHIGNLYGRVQILS